MAVCHQCNRQNTKQTGAISLPILPLDYNIRQGKSQGGFIKMKYVAVYTAGSRRGYIHVADRNTEN